MDTEIESLVAEEYPHLKESSFFDFAARAPLSMSQINLVKSLSASIQASPHSSEEQNNFIRTTSLLRERFAELFSTSQIEYAVVLFSSVENALDMVFEGFPWTNGSAYAVSDDFRELLPSSLQHASQSGATQANVDTKVSARSLYCFKYNEKNIESASKFKKISSGTRHLFCDATSALPYEIPSLAINQFDILAVDMRPLFGADLCACLIKLNTADLLSLQFYGGGAVAFSCARAFFHRHFQSHSKRLENGTPSALAINIAFSGLSLLNRFKESQQMRLSQISESFRQIISELGNDKVDAKSGNFSSVILDIKSNLDVYELQKLFATYKVYLGVSSGHLVATFGLGSQMCQLEEFRSSFPQIVREL